MKKKKVWKIDHKIIILFLNEKEDHWKITYFKVFYFDTYSILVGIYFNTFDNE